MFARTPTGRNAGSHAAGRDTSHMTANRQPQWAHSGPPRSAPFAQAAIRSSMHSNQHSPHAQGRAALGVGGLGSPPSKSLDAVIASATASVAEVCDVQVGQVKTALSAACEAEVRQLRAVLSEACSGETDKLRSALRSACDKELQRVSSSLATACAREVEAVSTSCQSEVERVKLALRTACELEVASVREACLAEIEAVRTSLREACEAEVGVVREACKGEVQRVKADLAEACQRELTSLVGTMRRDVELARNEQRAALDEAAAPYIMAVKAVQTQTQQQVDGLNLRADRDVQRVLGLEAEVRRNGTLVGSIHSHLVTRQRAITLDARLRHGAHFFYFRVSRADGKLAQLMGQRPQLRSAPHLIRLSRDGESLLIAAAAPPPSREPEPLPSDPLAEMPPLKPHVEPPEEAWRSLPLSELVSIQLGAPTWCARAAAFDASDFGAGGDEHGGGVESAAQQGLGAHGAVPMWRFVTLQPAQGTPSFLLAPSDADAVAWVAGLAPLLSTEAPSWGAVLWRRVRLRLDTMAAEAAERGVGGDTRLGRLARIMRGMADEERARLQWVDYHLSTGDVAGATKLGWVQPETHGLAVNASAGGQASLGGQAAVGGQGSNAFQRFLREANGHGGIDSALFEAAPPPPPPRKINEGLALAS